jgi:CDGSH-type Zn-finger protein
VIEGESMSVKITIRPNGPLVVDGDFTLVDAEGNEFQPRKKALCRCGGSTTKPYCDGTHSKIGFQGAIEAVEKSEGEK